MRFLFRNRKGVSNVFGYLFSFAVASMVMVSAVIMTKNVMDDRSAKVGNMEAQTVANKMADAIVEAIAAGQSMTDGDYSRALDLPNDIAGLDYYMEVTDKFVYVNTTNGVISKSCPNYGAGSSNLGIANSKIYGGSGSVRIILDRSDYVYKFDFGVGNLTSHSPAETGYFVVTNKSSIYGNDPPWLNEESKARAPILIENDSPDDLVNVPVKIVLSQSNFDYSMANVTINSSSSIKSDLNFYDPSMQVITKMSVSPSEWEPKWFYTSYYDPVTHPDVFVTINELSGGYDNSYIDGETLRLKVMGRTGGREAKGSWDVVTGKVTFNSKEALEMLEDGNHYLNPGYNIVLYGLLKNGVEFSGSKYISIKNAEYISYTDDGCIEERISSLSDGDTLFIKKGNYAESFLINSGGIDKEINLIGEDVDDVKITPRLATGFPIPIFSIIDMQNINIDSMTFHEGGSETEAGIYVQGSSYINITNCKVYNCNDGIRVTKQGSPLSSSHISIYNCKTNNSVGGGPGVGKGDGINIGNSNHIRITNCESYSNNNEKGDGFDITDSSFVILTNCLSHHNNGDNSIGILIEESHDCKILDSRIYSNTGLGSDGIKIHTLPESTDWCYNNLIKNCTITDNNNVPGEGCGINFQGNGPRILSDEPFVGNNTAEDCEISGNFIGVLISGQGISESAASVYNNVILCNIHNNLHEGVLIIEYILGLCWHNNITYCNIYNNGQEDEGYDGVTVYASWHNNISYCNIFDNGQDGLQLGGSILDATGVYWSCNNTIRHNNFYCNGKSTTNSTALYCKGGAILGFFGSNSNQINFNNFGYDYPYPRDCMDYNGKYALDDYNWFNADWKNNWDNNFWDNYDGQGNYYIPNSDLNTNYNYSNYDNSASSSRYPNPDYIIVTPSPPISQPITVTIKGINKTADTFINEAQEYEKNGELDHMTVDPIHTGSWPFETWQINRILIKFDLSEIPPIQNVKSANLSIYYREEWAGNNGDPYGRIHKCHMITGPWSENLVCWDNKPGNSIPETSSTQVLNPGNWKNWSVTNDVKNFLNGTNINRGWVIKDSNEGTALWFATIYDSTEKIAGKDPYLEIVYIPKSDDPGPHYHPRNITKGIENVIPGGTVFVKSNFTSGNLYPYKEKIIIEKPLTLKGERRDAVIMDGSGNGNIITIKKRAVYIDSLTIKNGDRGIYLYNNSLGLEPKINITNCNIYNNKIQGIFVTLKGVNIKDCNINNSGLGICITKSSSNILNCNIHNNTNSTGTNEGILLNTTSCQIIKIANCSINDNQRGIYQDFAYKITIENCILKRNMGNGIELKDSGFVLNGATMIKYCDIVGTGSNGDSNGIYLHDSSENNHIWKCDISNNKNYGIQIDSSSNNQINNSKIYGNNNYGIRIASSSNNLIYHNKFVDNNDADPSLKDAYDDGTTNIWDKGYPLGGNLWDDYDEPEEGAIDDNNGERTSPLEKQPDSGSDGIADYAYCLDPDPESGNVVDNYPWCKRPIALPYYIDYWNPKGESVILLNMSMPSYTSKYIHLYYGSTKSASNHSIAEVSLFFDDFNELDTNIWDASGSCTLDGKGNLSIWWDDFYYGSILTKNELVPKIEAPPTVDYAQTINQSAYIIEARMNINRSEGNMILDDPTSPDVDYSYWISVNQTPLTKNLSLQKDFKLGGGPGGRKWTTLKKVTTPSLDNWIRLKTQMYRSWVKYISFKTNQSKSVNITSVIYDYNSYADNGDVSYVDAISKINDNDWTGTIYTGVKIGLGCHFSNQFPNDLPPILVDWIRVMKTPVIPPTVTIGSMDSANYGWETTNNVYSKNIIPTGLGTFDNPFNPGPVLRDFNNGTEPRTFVIKNLPQDVYTITIIMGNASGTCNITKAVFNDSQSNNYGELIIPATEAGKFETRFYTINFNWGGAENEKRDLRLQFIGKWTVNSITIERGKKGVRIDY